MKRYLFLLVALLLLLPGCDNRLEVPYRSNHKIHLVSREDGSGTRGAFVELTGILQKIEGESIDYTNVDAAITNSTSVVLSSVSKDNHSIGYLSLGSLNDLVKGVTINGIPPTAEQIQSGEYPISRPFLFVQNQTENPIAQDFIAFVLSEEGQNIVQENGYVPLNETSAYQPTHQSGRLVIGGSSSVTPVVEKLKEAYQNVQPDVHLEVQQSDSTTGIASALTGVYDIGMSSRNLTEKELGEGLQPVTIALDGIVVVVSPHNPLTNLTVEQVREIFTGEISYWYQLEEEDPDGT